MPRSTRELCLGKPQLAGYLSFQRGARHARGEVHKPLFRFIRCLTRLQQLAGISASFPFGSGCTLRPRLAIKSRELMIAPRSEEPPPVLPSFSEAGEGSSSQASSLPRGYLLGRQGLGPAAMKQQIAAQFCAVRGLETPLHLPCRAVITIPQARGWCER